MFNAEDYYNDGKSFVDYFMEYMPNIKIAKICDMPVPEVIARTEPYRTERAETLLAKLATGNGTLTKLHILKFHSFIRMNESRDLDDYTLYEQINNLLLKVTIVDLKDDPEVDVMWVELIDSQDTSKLKTHAEVLLKKLDILRKPKDVPLEAYEELIARGYARNKEEQDLLDTLAGYHSIIGGEDE